MTRLEAELALVRLIGAAARAGVERSVLDAANLAIESFRSFEDEAVRLLRETKELLDLEVEVARQLRTDKQALEEEVEKELLDMERERDS